LLTQRHAGQPRSMPGSPAHESSSSPLSPGRHPIPSMYMWGTSVSSPASVSVVSTSRQCLPASVIVRQCPPASAKRPDRGRRKVRVYKREMYNSTRGIVNSKWKEPTQRGKKGNRSGKGGNGPVDLHNHCLSIVAGGADLFRSLSSPRACFAAGPSSVSAPLGDFCPGVACVDEEGSSSGITLLCIS
jgi:hypothetical protein